MDNFKPMIEGSDMPEGDLKCVLYAKIFDTDFHWGMPYKINVEKYKELIGAESRMTDEKTSSVRFEYEISEYGWHTLYIWTNNNDEKDWNYDCLMSLTSRKSTEEFKTFATNLIKDCVIDADGRAVARIMREREEQINELKELNKQIFGLL